MSERLQRFVGSLLFSTASVLWIPACSEDPAETGSTQHNQRAPESSGTDQSGSGSASLDSLPNVLVLMWDTVRADRLSTYGYEKPTSPHLDRLAADGVVFERAISPGMWTVPSHASLFTGLPVSAHGAVSSHKWLDDEFVTLAELLHERGYGTFAFSANPFLSGELTNLTQGFQTALMSDRPPWKERTVARTEAKRIEGDESVRKADPAKDSGLEAKDALLEWLDRLPDGRPFFAFVNYMEAHLPRIPPLAARRAVMTEDEIARSLTFDQKQRTILKQMFGLHEYSAEERALISAVYDAALVELDSVTGALLDALRERDVLDQTLVVVVADHGEHFGEHGRWEHKYSLYQALVRVPLVVRYPKRLEPGRVSSAVSVRNVFATVLDAADMSDRIPADLESLLSFSPETVERAAFSELVEATPAALKRFLPEDRWEPWLHTYQSVERGDFRLLRRSDGVRELYDTRGDPNETTDLTESEPDRVRELEDLLDDWTHSVPRYDLEAAKSGSGAMTPAMRRRLRELGYEGADEDERPADERESRNEK